MFELGLCLSPTRTHSSPLLFSGDLSAGLKFAKMYRYDGIEISLLNSGRLDRHQLVDEIQSLKLKVYAIATGQSFTVDGYYLYTRNLEHQRKALERLKDHIDLAAILDCFVIIGGIRGRILETGKAFESSVEKGQQALVACANYARGKGVNLLLEPINRYETNIINTLDEALDLMEKIGSRNFKLLLDTFHMNIEEKSIDECFIKAGRHIGHIHFADSNRMAPGWGHINFGEILDILKKIHYQGAVCFEILPKPDDVQATEQAIQYIRDLQGLYQDQ